MMRSDKGVVLSRLLLAAAVLTLIGALVAPASAAEAGSGESIYSNQCVSCHGESGGGGTGPALDSGAPMLTYSDRHTLRDKIDSAMPQGDAEAVTGPDAEAVTAYLVDELGNPAEGDGEGHERPMPDTTYSVAEELDPQEMGVISFVVLLLVMVAMFGVNRVLREDR